LPGYEAFDDVVEECFGWEVEVDREGVRQNAGGCLKQSLGSRLGFGGVTSGLPGVVQVN